jgi:hypothetical protein
MVGERELVQAWDVWWNYVDLDFHKMKVIMTS